MNISIRLANSLGCSVAGTAVIHSVIKKFESAKISVVTKNPTLLYGINGINVIAATSDLGGYFSIDLRKYTARRPHSSYPPRPSYHHMLEMAEEQLECQLPIREPKIFLQSKEITFAREVLSQYENPVIWLQTMTTSYNRNWSSENWSYLLDHFSKRLSFIDLSQSNYSPRESLAITTQCKAGICLDSFLIHGSAAVGAKNVIALLGSSQPEVVTYPGQSICYSQSACKAQPCGMHGYYRGCAFEFDSEFSDPQKICIHEKPICMESITLTQVIEHLESILNKRIVEFEHGT
jgi:ADP-heptose:LPS heptosyltransferase